MKKLEVTRCSTEEIARLIKGKPEFRTAIRLLAVYAVANGGTSRDASDEILMMNHASVCFWVKRFNLDGLAGLEDKPHPGRKALLSEERLAELRRIVLKETPEMYGFNTATWTGPLLISLIERLWNVEIKKATIYVLLKDRLGLSYQKGKGFYPEAEANIREAKIEAIKKTSDG